MGNRLAVTYGASGLKPYRADARLAAMGRLRRAWVLAGAVLMLAGAGCGSGPAGAPVRLDAGPAAAALVDPVHVSVSGLPPAGLVTVQARTLDPQGQPWVSAAVFRASAAGTLNLATAVPVSGSYHTADAAGLFWSLHPAPGTNQATNFSSSAAGFTVRLEVLTGGRVRASATLRRLLPVTVSVQAVHRDGFAGLLYTSAAVRPGAPAVVVLGGAAGGYDDLPALGLAMSGYPALALAYFDEPGLPQCLCSIPLEYFARAVGWLRAQPAGRAGRWSCTARPAAPRRSCCSPRTCRTWPTASWPAHPPRPSTPRTARHPARPGRSAASRWRPWGTSRSPASGSRC